jgi:type IV pilus assembly protein PilC
MAVFNYQAKALNGSAVQGQVEAVNENEARVKIRANRMIPMKLEMASGGPSATSSSSSAIKKTGGINFSMGPGKVKPKDLQNFTRQLAVLVGAGVAIIPSLEALSTGQKSPVFRKAITEVCQDISTGKKMGLAFARQGHVFDKFYINMIVAGEEGGVLELVLKRLADYIEKAVKIQGKIKGALVYPIAVLAISLLIITGLLIFVVPKFAELFMGSGMKLPFLTQMMMDMSAFMRRTWWMFGVGIFVLIQGLKTYYATSSGRQMIDALLIRTPLFGNLIIKGGLAKFTRTLSTLLNAGVSIMDAMDISGQVSGNYVIEMAIAKAKDAIASGKSIATPFSQDKMFPPLVVQMMAVGEATGALDQMLSKIADFFEDEVETIVSSITTLIEPVMIVVLGGIVAFLVLAMYMPIFQMAGGVQ